MFIPSSSAGATPAVAHLVERATAAANSDDPKDIDLGAEQYFSTIKPYVWGLGQL